MATEDVRKYRCQFCNVKTGFKDYRGALCIDCYERMVPKSCDCNHIRIQPLNVPYVPNPQPFTPWYSPKMPPPNVVWC